MKNCILTLGLASMLLLPSCATVAKVDEIADKVLQLKALAETKLDVLEAKAAAKDAELVAVRTDLEAKLGHAVTKDNVKDTVKEIATSPSLWPWIFENWDDVALLLAALGVGLPVGKLALKKGVGSLHQAGRAVAGPSQPPSHP